jgi:hypothetical protein
MDAELQRRHQSDGRRNGDAWLTRVLKIFAIVSAVSTVAFYGVPMIGVPARVDALEIARRETDPVMLLMTCGLYRKAYPDQVPALCDRAISRQGRR